MNYQKCASQHFGAWAIKTDWFAQAINLYNAGTLPKANLHDEEEDEEERKRLELNVIDGVAVIPIIDQMTKGRSSFGGTSTIEVRSLIREAARSDQVGSIMLHIDSPGGSVAGTSELANDIQTASELKPVFAHIDDLGASAALWVAVQAGRVTANEAALVGSIGVFSVIHDTSKMAEEAGVVVHVVSTGGFKGAFEPGTEVTEEQLSEIQKIIDATGQLFSKAIQTGRGMSASEVKTVADGRVFMATEAKSLGLIDGVMSFESAMGNAVTAADKTLRSRSDRARASQQRIKRAR